MDDQFQSRTDDDLFADDFEPIEEAYVENTHVQAPAVAEVVTSTVEETPVTKTSSPTPAEAPPALSTKLGSLSQSRHNPQRQRQRKQSPKPKAPPAKPAQAPTAIPPQDAAPALEPNPTLAPNGPPPPAVPGQTTAGPHRYLSGQNPRTKLTDAELEEKMQAMKLQNAERTRKFEQAEQDERSHEMAFKKGMEEARKRKAEEAERRKRAQEERKKLEDERERNRERKLKALGSWDQEKTIQEEPERKNFRGAHGGIRGERRGGLGGSRFADREGHDETSDAQDLDAGGYRGRGRGRGRGAVRGGGRGRGGFGAHDGDRDGSGASGVRSKPNAPTSQGVPRADEFPALPPSTKKIDTSAGKVEPLPTFSPGPNSPPVGKWDDEMEALDAKQKEQGSSA